MIQEPHDQQPHVTRTRVPYQQPDENPLLQWRPHFPPPSPGNTEIKSNGLARCVAFLMFLSSIVLGYLFRRDIAECLKLIDEIGSSNPQSQIKGLAVFGLILVALVAIVRILANDPQKGGGG